MEYRLKDNAREGIDLQLLFPTQIDIPSQNPGPLGAAISRCYNNWVHKLVAGYREKLLPVAMLPAGRHEQVFFADLRERKRQALCIGLARDVVVSPGRIRTAALSAIRTSIQLFPTRSMESASAAISRRGKRN